MRGDDMTNDDVIERRDELIALSVLGELDAVGEAELEAMAAQDPELRDELDEMRALAARLSVAGAPASADDLPADLRAGVLEAIDAVPQDGAAPDARPAGAGGDVVADDHARTGVIKLAATRRRFAPVLAAAAVAIAVVAGGIALVGGDSASELANDIEAVVSADDSTRRALDGELAGSLSVVHSPTEGAIVVEGSDLEPVTEGSDLQLWLVDDTGATSVGVFRPDADGVVSVRFDDVDPTEFVLGVTLEPEGGSEQPTLPILASA
ncbi:MAG: anti-sigma factor [Actinomycetota bacterium]